MTLGMFLNAILEKHEIAPLEVNIVQDNAQLCLKSRMRASATFAISEEAMQNKNCRWSRLKCVVSDSSLNAPPSRRSSLVQTASSCGPQNASWDRPIKISPLLPNAPPNLECRSQAPKPPRRVDSPVSISKLHRRPVLLEATSLSVSSINASTSSFTSSAQSNGNSNNGDVYQLNHPVALSGSGCTSSMILARSRNKNAALGNVGRGDIQKSQSLRNALGSMAPGRNINKTTREKRGVKLRVPTIRLEPQGREVAI
jgi:hypothetical protein